ncbi:MAG: hypothetical protein U0T77_07025 [Chitinophagales bacterium]
MTTIVKIFLAFIFISTVFLTANAQDEIDIVNPYEIKSSRSAKADTFYFTQHKTTTENQKLDTLRSYDVYLEERPTPFGTAYMCNGVEITKKKYAEYKLFWNASGACKPCMLYTYNNKDELKYVAFQYEDCLCGSYKEYYPEGALKTEGQFKPNTSGSWENLKYRNMCSIRDGLWTYYFEDGTIEKTETYKEGKLISSSNPLNTTGNVKKENTQTPDGTDKQKDGILPQKWKNKNKPANE